MHILSVHSYRRSQNHIFIFCGFSTFDSIEQRSLLFLVRRWTKKFKQLLDLSRRYWLSNTWQAHCSPSPSAAAQGITNVWVVQWEWYPVPFWVPLVGNWCVHNCLIKEKIKNSYSVEGRIKKTIIGLKSASFMTEQFFPAPSFDIQCIVTELVRTDHI